MLGFVLNPLNLSRVKEDQVRVLKDLFIISKPEAGSIHCCVDIVFLAKLEHFEQELRLKKGLSS